MGESLARLRRIGNSQGGIIFPKEILDEAGITGTVKIHVKGKSIVVTAAVDGRRKTWSDFKPVKRSKFNRFISNRFDEVDWI